MENRIYSMLSIASKAGRIVSGEDPVRNSIRQGKVKMLIISEDASANTYKRFSNAAAYYKVDFIHWGLKQQLGSSIGKSERSILGITDEGFCNNIKELVGHALNQKASVEQNAGGELFEQN